MATGMEKSDGKQGRATGDRQQGWVTVTDNKDRAPVKDESDGQQQWSTATDDR